MYLMQTNSIKLGQRNGYISLTTDKEKIELCDH